MKQVILFMAITFNAISGSAQTNMPGHSINYEAANWHIWLLDNPKQIMIAAPPSADQVKVELQTVKRRVSNVDEKKHAEIIYWNAGAPSYRWNQIAINLISWDKPNELLRTPASWMNVAIYDATILAWKEKVKYNRKRPSATDPTIKPEINVPLTYSYPCEHSVTAAAAATVLAYFYPEKADSILQLAQAATQSRIDAGVQFPSDVDAGWKLGEQVAKQIIEKAKLDGSAKVWKGTMNTDPKKWTGTYSMGIKLTLFEPMIMRSADQFRPAAPPDFEREMQELKNFKQTFSSRSLAYIWQTEVLISGTI